MVPIIHKYPRLSNLFLPWRDSGKERGPWAAVATDRRNMETIKSYIAAPCQQKIAAVFVIFYLNEQARFYRNFPDLSTPKKFPVKSKGYYG
jgi:hypothetical protein